MASRPSTVQPSEAALQHDVPVGGTAWGPTCSSATQAHTPVAVDCVVVQQLPSQTLPEATCVEQKLPSRSMPDALAGKPAQSSHSLPCPRSSLPVPSTGAGGF
eukprot:4130658-Alexandrium_andersonii.AAC.1